MNHGGSWNFDFGKVKYVNAIHSVHFLMALTEIQAVLLSRENTKHLHRGRYGLTMDMKLIPMRTKLIWLFCLLVTISLWISRMLSSDFIECDKVLGYHYDTFGYIEIDHKAAKSFPIKEKI
jgi:hypothetical protein